MISAEEARQKANEVVREKPEYKAIAQTIQKALELGEVQCEYTCGDRIDSRVQSVLEEAGYQFEYNSYTFNYTITW